MHVILSLCADTKSPPTYAIVIMALGKQIITVLLLKYRVNGCAFSNRVNRSFLEFSARDEEYCDLRVSIPFLECLVDFK